MLKKLSKLIDGEVRGLAKPVDYEKSTLVLWVESVSGHSNLIGQYSLYEFMNELKIINDYDKEFWDEKRITRDCIAFIFYRPDPEVL